MRLFRVDRFGDLKLARDRGYAFTGFDAASVWDVMVERVEGLRGAVQAELAVDTNALEPLLAAFGPHAAFVGEQPDGRSLVTVRAHTVTGLAEQLAGWTASVQVLEPAAVREALFDLGRRITEAYRD
jgi:predicted DNA-binding transcriptional regulator YafY